MGGLEVYFRKSNVLEARILRYQIFLKVLWESDDKGSCGVWEGLKCTFENQMFWKVGF